MSAGPVVRDRFVTVNGLRLRYRDWGGAGAPFLALHGMAAHAHWWDFVARRIAARVRVIALDLRGHGRSAWPSPPAYSTRDFTGDVLGVIERLDLRDVTLAGHSLGGHIAAAFAAWHPDRLARLVVLDTRPGFNRDRLRARQELARSRSLEFSTRAAALARFRLRPGGSIAAADVTAAIAAHGVRRLAPGRWAYRFDPMCEGTRVPIVLWLLLRRIAAPTLVVRGERSIILPRPMAERMVSVIPSARLDEIPGAHHHVTLDAPDAVARTLLAWLR